jgi:hypothetical protein
VGVHRDAACRCSGAHPHPHARGGAPRAARRGNEELPSSPRTWGCTVVLLENGRHQPLIPTHVGVHRSPCCRSGSGSPHPHARGGAPRTSPRRQDPITSSPRTWGCTAHRARDERARVLIPTHVGVHRSAGARAGAWRTHPHARGGAPHGGEPAVRRAVLIPTHVGVHRSCTCCSTRRAPHPHARGGAPAVHERGRAGGASSPRTWGCTDTRDRRAIETPLIPTHVGVYRDRVREHGRPHAHPHARGGAPDMRQKPVSIPSLIPTHVGVHRTTASCPSTNRNHPHAREGASLSLPCRARHRLRSPSEPIRPRRSDAAH